ncbi:MAG TPA: HlyC/CorC family transporter [Candidatus Cloacimonetes bacterium]|nr:HlyC/CorC family transporter [Candidatus Cloacimonadota bacterium]HEX37720.1 HlyC/CorC family transporter [Candidatus Cloacimonadota bacterium]
MISIIIVAIFFIGSAFFSGVEIGLISLDKHRLKHEAGKSQSKKQLYNFVTNPDKVLGTTLIGTNISLIIVSSVFTAFMIKREIMSETMATLLLSGVLLIFAEIIPKIIVRNSCNTSIPKMFFLIRFFAFLFHPLILVLSKINNSFFKLFRIDKKSGSHLFTKDDLSYLLEEAEKDGNVKKEEHDLIEEVLDFRDLTVKNIMIPRTNIVGVKSDTPISEVINLVKELGFTRFPVYSTDIDHIEGLLVIHDLLELDDLSQPAGNFIRNAYFVPEVMKATTLLKKIQQNKTPLAIVVDEYGGTAGIISVEDLLEELVGEIEDEYDAQENDINKIDDTTFLVDGEVEIERLIEDYNIELDEGDYETLAGMLIEKFERIPRYNEKCMIKNIEFTIKQVTARKIEKVMIKILPETTEN